MQIGEMNEKQGQSAEAVVTPKKRSWNLNIAYYAGDHFVTWDSAAGVLRPAYPKHGSGFYASNMVQPRVWIQYAKMLRRDPSFRVAVPGAGPDNTARARASYNWLWAQWGTRRFKRQFADMLLWAILTDAGYAKVIVDPAGGGTLDVAGEAMPLPSVIPDACSPFEIYPDPLARNLDEAAWVIHDRLYSVDYVKDAWGIENPAVGQFTSVAFLGQGGPRERMIERANLRACQVREFWGRPTVAYPRGRYALAVGNEIISYGDNPYHEAGVHIPFVLCRYLPMPGQLLGVTPVSGMRHMNVLYNLLRANILDNLEKLSNPLIVASVGSLSNAAEFERGAISFLYRNPFIPGTLDQLKIEPYPPHVGDMLQRLSQEMDDQSGLTEASRGKVPRGARAAEMMGFLLEQEDTRLSVLAGSYEEAIGDAMGMVLKLARRFVSYPQVLRVLGAEREYEARLFCAQDIPSDADVRVEPGSSLPQSGAALWQVAQNCWDKGLVPHDARGRELMLRLTKYGALEEAVADVELDGAQARREHDRMLGGEPVPVEAWHNHAIHQEEHRRFMKTVEFEEAAEIVWQAFKMHDQQHAQAMAVQPAAGQAQPGDGIQEAPRLPLMGVG